MENNFKRVHTGKDIIISTTVFLAGIGLFIFNSGLGILIAACGLCMFVVYKGAYKKDGQDILFTRNSDDICKVCKNRIIEFLEGKDVTPVIKRGNEGGCIRLDVYFNKDEEIAYAQVFDFCNYSYEQVTDMVELKGNRANQLIALL